MNFSKLDAFLCEMPRRGYPSCELAITKDGETVYRSSVGYRDEQGTVPASPDDLYWIFSCTKVLTCLAALRLLEEGKIALDDPVSKYLPAFAHLTVKEADGSTHQARETLTLRHLFTMTGGMTYDIDAPAIRAASTQTATTREIVDAMASMPLAFEPGTHYRYSLCHDVLGAVIEAVSGMTLGDYMRALFFEPLSLTDIGFFPTEAQRARFAAMYRGSDSLNVPKSIPCVNPFCFAPHYESGGAGLFSSVDDYVKILSVIACGGTTKDGYRILRPETIALAEQNLLHDTALADFVTHRLHGYGWGLCGRVHRDPDVSFSLSPKGEFGWDGAANAFALIDTKNRVALYFGAHVRGYHYGYQLIHPMLRNLAYECLEA